MVIAAQSTAPTHGPGRLIVDGADQTVFRKTTFSLHPTKAQADRLHALLRVSREVYNAALQERRDAWQTSRTRVTWQDQFNQVKDLRGIRDDVLTYGINPLRGAIMRCDEAFQAFFRRHAADEVPGYPRFKGAGRFNTACWDTATSWKIILTGDTRRLYLQGVGDVAMSKSARHQLTRLADKGGRPVTLTVTRRPSGSATSARRQWVWRATVGFADVAVEPTTPARGDGSLVGGDRGVKVALATSDGAQLAMPRYVAQMRARIIDLERARARTRKGSRAHRLLGRRIARARQKAAGQVDDWARTTASMLVGEYDVIVLEHLRLDTMTRSAKGTVEEPGSNVAAKRGLNRALTDAALGRLAVRICVKAESAGRRVWMVNPAHTSQACPAMRPHRQGEPDLPGAVPVHLMWSCGQR